MILFLNCIYIINEFIESHQETDDVSPTSNFSKVAENDVILETPQKPPQKLLFETPDPFQQSLSGFKDTGLFLSPAREKFHESIEKAMKFSEVVYNSRKLKEAQKTLFSPLICSYYDLVWKHPDFVGIAERNMQEIKEEFNKVVLSIFGSSIGKDNELCFPSYKNKKRHK
jgi:hypothetical protein